MFKKLTILYTILLIFVSVIPVPNVPIPKFDLFQWDKLFHFQAYLLMSLIWLRLGYLENKNINWLYLVLVSLIALTTEICQGILPIGRHFEISDIIANFSGILVGFIISFFYILKKKHR